MSCPHGNGPPSRCSQCLGAPARRIEQLGDVLILDDEARPVLPVEVNGHEYYKRGGSRRKPRL